ncbi:hypothetical protein NC651_037901 [Populus alba x Populus x berolinensis]|nr:hypothetical protein NC651_037901 [Populus alba x Populus x berolinensis]
MKLNERLFNMGNAIIAFDDDDDDVISPILMSLSTPNPKNSRPTLPTHPISLTVNFSRDGNFPKGGRFSILLQLKSLTTLSLLIHPGNTRRRMTPW